MRSITQTLDVRNLETCSLVVEAEEVPVGVEPRQGEEGHGEERVVEAAGQAPPAIFPG